MAVTTILNLPVAAQTSGQEWVPMVQGGTTVRAQLSTLEGPPGAPGDLIGSYVKGPFDCATTGPVTLSGVQTIDGVSGVAGFTRVFVLHQDNPAQNGGYVMAVGAWPRTTDMDTAAEVNGALCLIKAGPGVNGGKLFQVKQQITTLGTDRILIDDVPQGGSVQDQAGRTRGVYVAMGDSNRNRTGWWDALQRELRHSRSPLGLWTHYSMGVSGYATNGVLQTILSGDQAAVPVDTNPSVNPAGFSGDVYRVINAFPDGAGGILDISLGTNDLAQVSSRAAYDTLNRFQEYLDRVVYWFLARLPTVAINLTMPAPFVGEDFIQGPTNFTQFGTVPGSGGSVIEGAAICSNVVRQAYLKWIGRHPRVSVYDTTEIFGTRIDDKAINGQDPEGQGALMDETLHYSALAARRIVQGLVRHYGLSYRARRDTVSILPPNDMVDAHYRGWFRSEQAGIISGSDTRLIPFADPGALFTNSNRAGRRTGALPVPTMELDRSDLSDYFRQANPRELLTLKRDFKIWFPATGNVYTPTGITLFSSSTTPAPESLPRLNLLFQGVTMDAADRAAGAEWCVYATTRLGRPYQTLVCQLNMDNAGGGAVNSPYDYDWVPSVFQFARGNYTNTIDVTLYAQNQNDGRLIDAGVPGNPHVAPGAVVASGTLNNLVHGINLTLNATNWPSGFLWKPTYRLVGRVTSGTLVGQGSFTVRT